VRFAPPGPDSDTGENARAQDAPYQETLCCRSGGETQSRQVEEALELEARVSSDPAERGGTEPDRVVIRERELASRCVAIHAVGAALPHEHKARSFQSADHTPRGKIGHQAATMT